MPSLRWWGGFTAEWKRLPSGEGQGLLSPIRRPSLPNRRVALRGPAPRAKPLGALHRPWGFLPRIKSEVGGYPNPLWVKTALGKSEFPSASCRYDRVQSRDLGSSFPLRAMRAPRAVALAMNSWKGLSAARFRDGAVLLGGQTCLRRGRGGLHWRRDAATLAPLHMRGAGGGLLGSGGIKGIRSAASGICAGPQAPRGFPHGRAGPAETSGPGVPSSG